jgi:hypothetical protein
MPLSFRNIINGNELSNAITSGDFSKVLKNPNSNSAKYIKGYAKDTAAEALANSLNINKGLFKQAFGLEDKKLDAYDPYHTQDAKREEFWYDDSQNQIDGKEVQKEYDSDTDTFKRALYSEFGFRSSDFWYEDPFLPSFELYFDEDSPFFTESTSASNGILDFYNKYQIIDTTYSDRIGLWREFKNVFFKIFETTLQNNSNRGQKSKSYYITKIAGLNNLNKKIIKYGEDKITITLNEDVSMVAYYLSELYNNIIYSYKNQRYMFPDNVLRFNMIIKINDMRNFQTPQSNDSLKDGYENNIAPKSKILYTLHDCNFNFFQSRNYGDDLEIGGYGAAVNNSPQVMTFEIIYKSVTRTSDFPLIATAYSQNSEKKNSYSLHPWDKNLMTEYGVSQDIGSVQDYFNDIDRIKQTTPTESKGFFNQLLSKAAQTVSNAGLNYMDNLESKLRDVRGSAVNSLLSQFRTNTVFNKIEPDNVYLPNFNDRASVENFGKQVASGLLNDLESTVRDATNF